MVSNLSIAFLFVTAFISIVLPVVVAIIFWSKSDTKWWVFLVGMLGFVITQMVIRIPLMQFFATQGWYTAFAEHTIPFYLVTAFTAGLFETAGRLLVFLVFIRMRRNYADGFLAGLGHGTIESILIAGSSALTYLAYAFMINNGTFDVLVGPTTATETTKQAMDSIYQLLTGSSSVTFLASGIERFLTIILHIALSILVLEGIERKKTWQYAGVAVLYHMFVDFTVPLVYRYAQNIWISELLVAILVIPAVIYIFKAKQRFAHIAASAPKKVKA